MKGLLSPCRLLAMIVKELIQMRRDRMTFAIMFGLPIIQILLFGLVINSDPRHLPTAALLADNGPAGRTLLQGLKNSTYFDFVRLVGTEHEGRSLLTRGEVQFVINIPQNFSHDLLRGDKPAILLEADATDPIATSGGAGALANIVNTAFQNDFVGPLEFLAPSAGSIDIRVHSLYNPEAITSYNIVPGLMGVVLTMTLVMVTALAITREYERGTMENLLSMPLRASEVLVGKIVPYILVGYVQVGVILLVAHFLFKVPVHGNLLLLLLAALFFIAANLALGITFSTVARNQLQAMQMAMFVILPSILLSGFLFPFRGMPWWAQVLGEILPITHFLRIARGVMLKGIGFADVGRELWPIILFAAIMLVIAVKRYRQTLD
jgi:ABC-2 type transport system permease protein